MATFQIETHLSPRDGIASVLDSTELPTDDAVEYLKGIVTEAKLSGLREDDELTITIAHTGD